MAASNGLLHVLLAAGALLSCGGAATTQATADGTGSASDFIPANGAQLHYTLDLPAGPGPFPAVVMGHGAGRTTRDETRFLVPFWTAHGFAVLRYDRRGAGRSTGTYVPMGPFNSEAVVPELAGDMLAGVEFLKARPDIVRSRIGLMGISQAGWVMVAAAERSRDVAFFVAAVGSTLPVATNTYYEGLRTLPIDEAYRNLAAWAGSPGWDPVPSLRGLDAPALWLMGDDDRLVPTRICAPIVRDLAATGRRFTVHTYPGGHELGGALGTWGGDLERWLAAQGLFPSAPL